jgi:hypothetical protein
MVIEATSRRVAHGVARACGGADSSKPVEIVLGITGVKWYALPGG